jgi:hypothetical protein
MRQSGIQAQQIGQADEPSEEAEEVTVSKEYSSLLILLLPIPLFTVSCIACALHTSYMF